MTTPSAHTSAGAAASETVPPPTLRAATCARCGFWRRELAQLDRRSLRRVVLAWLVGLPALLTVIGQFTGGRHDLVSVTLSALVAEAAALTAAALVVANLAAAETLDAWRDLPRTRRRASLRRDLRRTRRLLRRRVRIGALHRIYAQIDARPAAIDADTDSASRILSARLEWRRERLRAALDTYLTSSRSLRDALAYLRRERGERRARTVGPVDVAWVLVREPAGAARRRLVAEYETVVQRRGGYPRAVCTPREIHRLLNEDPHPGTRAGRAGPLRSGFVYPAVGCVELGGADPELVCALYDPARRSPLSELGEVVQAAKLL